jgi:hypothetical protein
MNMDNLLDSSVYFLVSIELPLKKPAWTISGAVKVQKQARTCNRIDELVQLEH